MSKGNFFYSTSFDVIWEMRVTNSDNLVCRCIMKTKALYADSLRFVEIVTRLDLMEAMFFDSDDGL